MRDHASNHGPNKFQLRFFPVSCVCVCMCLCVCVCLSVCLSVCMYVCMYVCRMYVCFQSYMHSTKYQESVNGNVAEICETVAETRRLTRVSAVGLVTFTRVSVAAVTTEPDHFLHVSVRFQLKETSVSAGVISC